MMSLTRLIAVLMLAIAATTTARAAEPTTPIDDLFVRAAASPAPASVLTTLVEAQTTLTQVASKLRAGGSDPAITLSSRTRIYDGLKKAAELEASGDLLEALRLLTRVGVLSASIADTEPREAPGRGSLDRLTKAVYDRLVRLGAADLNGPKAFGTTDGERLIYRMVFADKGHLVAFELAGNDARSLATWRQTQIPVAGDRLRTALRQLKPKAVVADPDKPGKIAKPVDPVFAVVLGPAFAPATLAAGRTLAKSLEPLSSEYALPVAIEPVAVRRPIAAIPAIAQGSLGDDAVDGVVLIERSSGAVIGSWPGSAGGKLSAKVVGDAQALAREVATDLNLEAQTPVDVASFIPDVLPLDPPSPSFGGLDAAYDAPLTDSDQTLLIEPWFALQETARLPTGWSRYAIHGRSEHVWLRPSRVGPYVEYPDEAKKSGLFAMVSGNGLATLETMAVKPRSDLIARPFPNSQALRKLADAELVDVLARKPATPAVAAVEQVGKAKASPADVAALPAYAFVRAGKQVGWIEASKLVAPKADDKPGAAAGGSTAKTTSVGKEPKPASAPQKVP